MTQTFATTDTNLTVGQLTGRTLLAALGRFFNPRRGGQSRMIHATPTSAPTPTLAKFTCRNWSVMVEHPDGQITTHRVKLAGVWPLHELEYRIAQALGVQCGIHGARLYAISLFQDDQRLANPTPRAVQ